MTIPESGLILAFDKPLTWTSFQLVNKARRMLCLAMGVKKLKVGHAGTLDPLATGVLILCVGKATKRISELQAGTKEYVATLQLGVTTPSFDRETEPDATFPTDHITEANIREVLPQFTGHIMQVPPAFSACKVDGHRAYALARKGETPDLQAKPLVIDEMELLDFAPEAMQLTLRIVCSKGTYIRALARDIGQALHSGAHLTALRRTRVGEYTLNHCRHIETFDPNNLLI